MMTKWTFAVIADSMIQLHPCVAAAQRHVAQERSKGLSKSTAKIVAAMKRLDLEAGRPVLWGIRRQFAYLCQDKVQTRYLRRLAIIVSALYRVLYLILDILCRAPCAMSFLEEPFRSSPKNIQSR